MTATDIILLALGFLVGSLITLPVLLKRSATPTGDDGTPSTKDSEVRATLPSMAFPWYESLKDLTPMDLEQLSALLTSIEHWKKEIDQGKLSCQIPSPTVLASITRGRFQAVLSYDSGYFTIVLRDAATRTKASIDSISATSGGSN